ncbi:hypothetical protein ILUMI_01089 [Ignelater luminosus]|uniref:Uncharacterized protein n=1 Tax=Ignelater luminosus TaxID=2038154 RepID=A0A8K0DF18_IGNLU|nr:hypothetical protein ILUMI_01089 [Ignelater luminosus]
MALNYYCYCAISKHLKDLDHLHFCHMFNIEIEVKNLTNKHYLLNNIMEMYHLDVNVIKIVEDIRWKHVYEDHKLLDEFLDEFRDNYDWTVMYDHSAICWFDVAEALIFSEEFIKEFNKGEMIWYYICKRQELSEEFIRKYKDRVNWFAVSRYQKLSQDFLIEFRDRIKWGVVSVDLSEELIREHKDEVNWNAICRKRILSEEFIREFRTCVNWYIVTCYQELSESFIREFEESVYWENISQCQDLSENFVKEYKDKISWVHLSYNNKMPEKLVRKLMIWKFILPVIPYMQMIQRSRLFQLRVLEVQIFKIVSNVFLSTVSGLITRILKIENLDFF